MMFAIGGRKSFCTDCALAAEKRIKLKRRQAVKALIRGRARYVYKVFV